MKYIKATIAVILITLLQLQTIAFAYEFSLKAEVIQGGTLEIRIPKFELSDVKGTFLDEEIKFYQVTQKPKDDEPISRGEFLEMMFTNYDFDTREGKIDTTEIDDFPDVLPTNPYYEYIKKAAALNIINGYEDGLFRPYKTITRGQTAKILVNAFDPPEILKSAPRFTDIPLNHRFFAYINRAVKAKIFEGYPDGYMRADRDINFLEAEIVIKRIATPEHFNELGESDYFRGFVGVHRLSETGEKTLNIKLFMTNDKSEEYLLEEKNIPITIIKRDYPVNRFSMAEDKTKLFGDDDINKTWKLIDDAKKNTSSEQLWSNEFIIPTTGEETLGFGDKLYINGSYVGSHFGYDWANSEGTKVNAANSGIVTLAEFTPSYGNTVVIDHGQNIFTMYLHLQEVKTKKGTKVKSGDLIGLMGETGIATGPHLHFTHFVGSIIVDSQEWVENTF